MRRLRLKAFLSVAFLAFTMACNAVALTNPANSKPRPERLVFPNVVDDACEDTYSPLIFSFVGGAIFVAAIRTLVVRLNRRHAEGPVVHRTLL